MKLGQMKIQQMAFMLIVITLFFALVAIFVISFKYSGLKQSASELEKENAMMLVTKLANSPEFSCGESFGNTKINCIDEDKIMALRGNDAYSEFWSVSNIEIRKIYPKNEEKICNSGNYPNCSIIKMYTKEVSGFDASNFVSLCRKELLGEETYDKCELAKMMISYEKNDGKI